ncbi:hypothetical protein T07_4114 [Trichinella nelsoni]|uniref:G-protein coupled receptors family 1 profile domain-containing protein n=1 Tax=Trichinella nelsoni TaxID=6336 RepID=A0A0V0RH76_9BILA|nr:hypothetical protein T07_4114 [Trichinella nelsoni]
MYINQYYLKNHNNTTCSSCFLYIINIGFAWGSVVNGLADLVGFFRRLIAIHSEARLMTRLQCLLQGVNLMPFFVGETVGTVSIFFLCSERFLSIYKPYQSIQATSSVTRKVGTGTILSLAVFTVAISFYVVEVEGDQYVRSSCFGNEVLGRLFYDIHYTLNACIGLATVLLYMVTFALIKRKTRNSIGAVADIQLRRQVVVTKRLSSLLLSTFLLQVVPFFLLALSTWSESLWKPLISVTIWPRGIGMSIYPVVLIAVQPELRLEAARIFGKFKTNTASQVSSTTTQQVQ